MQSEPNNENDDPDAADGFAETHRPFVRNMDRAFSTVYGVGGLVALGIGLFAGYLGYRAWSLWSVSTWMVGITGLLAGLFALRMVIRLTARRFFDDIRTYCGEHNICVDRLRDEFGEHLYPYFESIFEMKERHIRAHDRTSE